MLNIGSYNELVVEKKVDFGLYLGEGEDKVLLPSKHIPKNTRIGDTLKVFIYTDSEDRPVATTIKPKGIVGDFVYLEAKDNTSFGTFMDWGLEKDLLVPNSEQQDRLITGHKYVVKICLDEMTYRVFGTARILKHSLAPDENINKGQKISLLIYKSTKLGVMAVIDNKYSGMLYKNELYEKLEIGDVKEGYVGRIRDDGKIDLTMKKPGYESVKDSTERLLDILKKCNGFIPCTDKSSPDEIKKIFSMSKKEFKRTIGGLYKKRIIDFKDNGISLIKK